MAIKPAASRECHALRRRKAFFAYFLWPFGQKVRRQRDATRDLVLSLTLVTIQTKTGKPSSPVPAGSRVNFFARPKKVTKERA